MKLATITIITATSFSTPYTGPMLTSMRDEAALIKQFARNQILNEMPVEHGKNLSWEAKHFDELDRFDREYGRRA